MILKEGERGVRIPPPWKNLNLLHSLSKGTENKPLIIFHQFMSCFKKKLLMYHFQICFLNPRMNNNSKNIFFHLKIKVKGMLIIVKLTIKRKKGNYQTT